MLVMLVVVSVAVVVAVVAGYHRCCFCSALWVVCFSIRLVFLDAMYNVLHCLAHKFMSVRSVQK